MIAPTGPDDRTLANWVFQAKEHPPSDKSWIDLLIELRHIAAQDRSGNVNPNLSADLFYSLAALHRIVAFLKQQPHFMHHPADIEPIHRLYRAVENVREGRASPMLSPVASGGHPGKSVEYETLKAFAARAMSELMECGLARNKAAQKVAMSCCNFHGIRDFSWKTIAGWRDKLEQGPGPGATARALDAYRKPLPAAFGSTPQERGKALLDIVAVGLQTGA